jgi:hypothetical protein
MKLAPALLVVLALFLAACGSAQPRRERKPISYGESMELIAIELESIDKHLTGDQYEDGRAEAQRAEKLAGQLASFDPQRMGDSDSEYEEFYAQCEDLRRALDMMLYQIEQRRKIEAREELVRSARRYNRLSQRFGPGRQVTVFDPSATTRGSTSR